MQSPFGRGVLRTSDHHRCYLLNGMSLQVPKECRCQIIFMPRFVGKPHHFLDSFLSAPKNSSVFFVGNQPSPKKNKKLKLSCKKTFKSQKIPPLFLNKKIHPTFIQPISSHPSIPPSIHIRPNQRFEPDVTKASNLGHCWTGVLPIHHQACPVCGGLKGFRGCPVGGVWILDQWVHLHLYL